MKVSIIQFDIDAGHCNEPLRCAVASAVYRVSDQIKEVAVYPRDARIYIWIKPSRQLVLKLPQRICDWALRFDNRQKVEPIEFDLPGLNFLNPKKRNIDRE